jgi:hypothetical protein
MGNLAGKQLPQFLLVIYTPVLLQVVKYFVGVTTMLANLAMAQLLVQTFR